uniref:Defective in cullin neddylation protein n=1 Tax=Brassica campestris TaxID=3711 RepID=M4EW92_BRACM
MDSSPVSGRLDIFEIYRRFCEIRSSQGLCNNIYKPPYEEASSQRANYLKEALTQLLTLVENKFQPRNSIFDELFKLMSRLDLMAKDTWQQVLVFSRCVHENLEGYDSQGASPVLIDEFVEQMYSILGPRKNTSLSCNCGDRESESCLYEDPLSDEHHKDFRRCNTGLRSVPGLKRKTSKDYDEEEVSENEYAFSSPNMKRIRSEDSPGCSSKTHCAIERSLSQGFASLLSTGDES